MAALAAFLGRRRPGWDSVECSAVTFGAPHVLSKELAEDCIPFVTSFINSVSSLVVWP